MQASINYLHQHDLPATFPSYPLLRLVMGFWTNCVLQWPEVNRRCLVKRPKKVWLHFTSPGQTPATIVVSFVRYPPDDVLGGWWRDVEVLEVEACLI